jgi:AraC family transcriptional regulator of arabinose operon
MKPDKNDTIYWNYDVPPMGCGFWPVMMGYLKSYGNSHYLNPSPTYFCPHIILKGRGVVCCNGQKYPVEPGSMFSIWPGRPIDYYDIPKQPWEYLWIHLGGEGTERFLNGCGFSPDHLVFKPGDPVAVKRDFWQIRNLYAKRDIHTIPLIITRFYEMIIACDRRVDNEEPRMSQDLVQQAVTYIEAMLNTPIDINHIAASLGVCRTTLYRAFVQNKGITPVEYLSSRRIERARELLKTTDLKLADICKSIGFSEQRYFIRCFREHTGTTPGVFRTQHHSPR